MSYSLLLIIFVCLPLAGILRLLHNTIRRVHLILLIVLTTLAILYATPWDNYLVATGVWSYDRNLALNIPLFYVPIAEYIFIVLQTLLTGFFVFWLWRRFYPADFAAKSGMDDSESDN